MKHCMSGHCRRKILVSLKIITGKVCKDKTREKVSHDIHYSLHKYLGYL